MSDIAIRVENLGKRYVLSHKGQSSGNGMRHAIQDVLAKPFRAASRAFGGRQNPAGANSAGSEDFWALNDVSFEVKRGEVVGIIGRNGAGKSTLLKTLSRITEPTKGSIEIEGRVASLLEVGTGFHPELTGRENIFLNGAILGMTRAEIRGKFDEIVAFAEVEKFLDTPVKRYSSGMYVRLAFAVAAHLEPEILVVDEVLAVGDAEFQKKCLGKMQDVSRAGGRTILFVSHNMAAVQSLCSRGVVLNKGTVGHVGDISSAVSHYYSAFSQACSVQFKETPGKAAEILSITADLDDAKAAGVWNVSRPLNLLVEIQVNRAGLRLDASARLESATAGFIHTCFGSRGGVDLCNLRPGRYQLKFEIVTPGLVPGRYQWSVWLHDPMRELYDYREAAIGMDTSNDQMDFTRLGTASTLGCLVTEAGCGLTKLD